MLPLSVVIIARNEADRIGAAITSVGWAEEVVVLDAGSADETVSIARSLGARVIEADWPGFLTQKNRALVEARHDWVLSLDADERVPPALADEIRRFREQGPGAIRGLSMPRLNWWSGRPLRHGTWYPDRQLRMVDRRHARWTGIDPHPRLEVVGPVQTLIHPLHHHPYRSLAEHLSSIDRYTRTQAGALYHAGRRAHAWDLLLRPPAHLLKALVLKGGLLDGWRGLAVASLGMAYVQLKWLRLWLHSERGEETSPR